MSHENLQDLIARLEARDEAACKRFIRQYQRLVFHVVCKYIPRPQDQEDLAQDIFIKIFDNIGTFHGKCKLSTWIGTIAYHASMNYIKKSKAGLYEDMHPDSSPDERFGSDSELPDDVMVGRESADIIRREIAKLPAHYQTVITLFHLEQMRYAEIGEIMDLPEGTVKSHLFRARQQLKKALTKALEVEVVS